LGRHPATTAASTAATETAAAAGTAAETASVTETTTAGATAAKASTITTAETAPVTETTTAEAAAALVRIEILVAETVPLVLAAPAAASVKTHALLVTFASPVENSDEHAGRKGHAESAAELRFENQYRQVSLQGRTIFGRFSRLFGGLASLSLHMPDSPLRIGVNP
jgi:hypothetical protein